LERVRTAAKTSVEGWSKLQFSQQREFVRSAVKRVIIAGRRMHIEVAMRTLMGSLLGQKIKAESTPAPDREILTLSADLQIFKRGCETRIVTPDSSTERAPVQSIVKAIAQSHDWYKKIVSGQIPNIAQLVQTSGLSLAYVRRILQCANIAPPIVERILKGRHSPDLTLRTVVRRPPLQWAEQDIIFRSSQIGSQTPLHE
jgi:hypothetical protein